MKKKNKVYENISLSSYMYISGKNYGKEGYMLSFHDPLMMQQ